MSYRNLRLIAALTLMSLATGCALGTRQGWHWQHAEYRGEPQLSRDLYDCKYYASITSSRAFGTDRPIDVQEWEEPVQECMAKRGWTFVDPQAGGN